MLVLKCVWAKVIYFLIILIVSSNNSGELWGSCLLSHMGAVNGLGTVVFLEVEKNEIERHENSALFPFLEFITLADSRK